MRAAPDVILIGEIRDRETMEAAIKLAGTGHLVLATLHANNAAETLDRIINMFPRDQHTQIFLDLSQYLRAIISQRLVPGKNKRVAAAVEVMLNTPHMQELIKKGDVIGVKEALRTSEREGHAELRHGAVRPLQARAHHAGRGAGERRLAHQPRSEDQLRLRVVGRKPHVASADRCRSRLQPDSANTARRVEHGPVHADALHRRAVRRLHEHRAARAAADPARHELLERDLARERRSVRGDAQQRP